MFNKFHYGGDLQTFMTQMDDILNTNLTRGYPGGPLEFLANWETAAVRLESVTRNEDWSDSAKRIKFSQRFMVLRWTDTVCESVLDTTQTWYDFVDSLRRKLTRREFKSKNSNSRINNTILDLEQNYSYYNSN